MCEKNERPCSGSSKGPCPEAYVNHCSELPKQECCPPRSQGPKACPKFSPTKACKSRKLSSLLLTGVTACIGALGGFFLYDYLLCPILTSGECCGCDCKKNK